MALTIEDETDAHNPYASATSPDGVAEMGTRTGASDDDAVTGPMPVVDLAEGHLHVSLRRGVTILTIDGGLDDDLGTVVAPLVASAIEGSDAVILDLDQTTLLDRTALEAVVDRVLAAGPGLDRCIVSGRLSGRLVLERWEVLERFVVFSSVADALQARAFVESGYGTGWASSHDIERRRD